jgi:dihydrofolate reductase
VTKIHTTFPADRFFPDLDRDDSWEVVNTEGPFSHQDLTYSYVTYERKHTP